VAQTTVDNGKAKIGATLVNATAVTRDKVKETIIADGFYTAAQVCTAEVAAACTELGIK
jgi:D-xylose transport system substrate-binding protein